MRPTEALDAQVKTVRFLSGPDGIRHTRMMIENRINPLPFLDAPEDLLHDFHQCAVHGEVYAVQRDLCDLLELASLDVPSYPLLPQSLFTRSGFVVFDRLFDDHGTGEGTVPAIAGFGYCESQMHRFDEEGQVRHGIAFHTYTRMPLAYGRPERHDVLTPCAWQSWAYGEPWDADRLASPETRIFAAFLRLVADYVTLVPTERHARRRAERGGLYSPSDVIKVVALRRSRPAADHDRDDGHDGYVRDWQARELVRGHWKAQWYPSLNANLPIYIDPYPRGPKHLPIAQPKTILDVRR